MASCSLQVVTSLDPWHECRLLLTTTPSVHLALPMPSVISFPPHNNQKRAWVWSPSQMSNCGSERSNDMFKILAQKKQHPLSAASLTLCPGMTGSEMCSRWCNRQLPGEQKSPCAALGSDLPSLPTPASKGLWALGVQELNCLWALVGGGSCSHSATYVPLFQISLSKEHYCLGQTRLDWWMS